VQGRSSLNRTVLLLSLMSALCGAASGIAAADTVPPAPAIHDGTSSWTITPYLWGPDIKGSVSLGNLAVPLDVGIKELGSGIKFGAMGHVQWRRDHHFVYFEGLDLAFGNRAFAPFFAQNIKASVIFVEAGYGRLYQQKLSILTHGPLRLSPYVGLRHVRLAVEVINSLQSLQVRDTWLDPAIGVIAEAPLSGSLSLALKSDVAGLGVGHDHYWNWIASFRYRFNPTWTVAAGYRATGFHADPGDGNQATLRLRGNGPLLALSASF
jgi:hypothetical protein